MAEVRVIKKGHLRLMGGMVAGGSSTVTLIRSDKNVIVDTAMSRDEDEILSVLKEEGLGSEDIDIVVNTHPHADHTGNNRLFSSAVVFDNGDDKEICLGARMIYTPGHTKECYSVIVKGSEDTVAIVGDLIALEDDLMTGRKPHSYDFELQKKNRDKICGMADKIIVGHGGMIESPGVSN